MPHQCPYCGKRVKTARGVKQHINQSPRCLKDQEAEITNKTQAINLHDNASDRSDSSSAASVGNKLTKCVPRTRRIRQKSNQVNADTSIDFGNVNNDSPVKSPFRKKHRTDDLETSDEEDFLIASDDDAMEEKKANAVEPNVQMLADFRDYCNNHANKHLGLRQADKTSIKLLHVLKQKAPLSAYQDVLEWHLKESGRLKKHQTLKDIEQYSHRNTLLNRLFDRYNLRGLIPKMQTITLPSSRAVVSIPCNNAADCIVSLLTDPRFKPADYLFFDNDPLADPPDELPNLADMNTGDAYLESFRKLITKPNQVLLPIPLYIDGAVTGQFTDLPITALKMSLGIHNRTTRDHDYAWRPLGFVPAVRKGKARGKRIFQQTGHLEVEDVMVMDGEGDETSGNDDADQDGIIEEDPAKAQDFHTMIATILESLIQLIETGFVWDLVYNGKLYKNIEFVLFVPYVKCDTEEADLLCGKYLVRSRFVKHLCRYCHCPTDEADNPRANYPLKTQKHIEKLIQRGDLARLKQISQQYIKNAWYRVRFHQANDAGIHGACPSEKLHAIQLGIFKYIREIFFQYLGKKSSLADDINGLAVVYGKSLTRQSERDIPNTNFAQGIQKGKVMARDFRGILLIMAAVLQSSMGKKLLLQRKKFGGEAGLRDWSLLVELLLEWEAYLCEKTMNRKDVKRLAKKHVFIMYIIRQVAQRTQGMGLKLMKFHSIKHLINDMLLYGTPMEFDTGSNESHHKAAKYAAKLTQRKEETFNFQTAKRLIEFHCIDLAMQEVTFGEQVWTYFDDVSTIIDAKTGEVVQNGSDSGSSSVTNQDGVASNSDGSSTTGSASDDMEIKTFGTRIQVFEDEEDDFSPSFRFLSRSGTVSDCSWNNEVIVFLNNLQNLVISYIPEPFLPIRTEHRRGKTIFRGHPNYRSSGRPWKDWVLVDWGPGYGSLPSHIWCFVCLTNMPIGGNTLQFGGINLADGVYAVVEVANYTENDVGASDFFTPLELEVGDMDENGTVTGRRFYLANTEAFVGTCCVIPDIGGRNNSYFQVKPRAEWTKLFIAWLKAPHREDVMEFSDDEEEATSDEEEAPNLD